MAQYDLEDEDQINNGPLPKKKEVGPPAQMQNPSEEKSDYPPWENLSDELKAAYKNSPMVYARKMLEAKITRAKNSDTY